MTVKVDEKELGERKKSGEESGFDDDGYGQRYKMIQKSYFTTKHALEM